MDIGSAQRTLDIMKELLADVDRACKASGMVDDAHNKIITNVKKTKQKTTMSDRGSVEKALNTLFDSYRASLLPKALGNWEEMTDKSRNSMTQVNHFYCGLHFLVGLADQAAEVLTPGTYPGGVRGVRTNPPFLWRPDQRPRKHVLDKRNYAYAPAAGARGRPRRVGPCVIESDSRIMHTLCILNTYLRCNQTE